MTLWEAHVEKRKKWQRDSDFIKSPSLTELPLHPISNYGRVPILKTFQSFFFPSCWSFFFVSHFFSLFHQDIPQVCQTSNKCMSLTCATLSNVCKSRGPINGFPPEHLDRATKASNYPWPTGSSSLFFPLWAAAACSTLLSRVVSLALFAPSHVQNNPSVRRQLLIAAISDKGNVWGKTVPKVSQGEGLQHLRICRRCLESHCFDSSNSLFHLWGKLMLENRSLTARKTGSR